MRGGIEGNGGGVDGFGGEVGGGGNGDGGGDGGGMGVGRMLKTEYPAAVWKSLQPIRPPRSQCPSCGLSPARYATKLQGSCWFWGRRMREQPGGIASVAHKLKHCSRETCAKPLQLTW